MFAILLFCVTVFLFLFFHFSGPVGSYVGFRSFKIQYNSLVIALFVPLSPHFRRLESRAKTF